MYRQISRTSILLLLACTTVVGALSGCKPPPSDAAAAAKTDKTEDAEADPIPVETLTVESHDFVESFDVPAKAEPVDEITVAAEAGGRVLRAPFEEGEEVRAGSTLLRVDTELDSARIDLLENQIEAAQREYNRTKKLVDQGLATPQQLDQAEDALENARLNLEQAKIGASKGGVRSPSSGVVLHKHIEVGEFASPGAPIATIVNYDKLHVVGHVPETRIRYVNVGDTVEVAFPARDATLTGQVTHRALTASPRTGTYAVEVTVDNPERAVLPGMSARMKIVKKQWEDVVIVPREAVLQGFSRSETMVLPGDDDVTKAELHVVELGPSAGPNVVITRGLEPGQRLIVRGHRGLVDGALARAVRHFDSIDTMRGAAAAADLSESASKNANPETSEGQKTSEGKGQ